MKRRGLRILAAVCGLALGSVFVLPEPADARGAYRRNYAEEWEREEREERFREEREKAREERLEAAKERQERYLKHRERQLDTVIEHHERTGHYGLHEPVPSDAAPPQKTGTCIYGADDKVVYQPKGVVCAK